MAAHRISEFLTPNEPLGPPRHERINQRLGDGYTNLLLYRTDLFDQITKNPRPILAGRRGSGKTALVNALVANAYDAPYSSLEGSILVNKKMKKSHSNIVVHINTWSDFVQMRDNVESRITHKYRSMGASFNWQAIDEETIAQYWSDEIWTKIFETIDSKIKSNNIEIVFHDTVAKKMKTLVESFMTGKLISSESYLISTSRLYKIFQDIKVSIFDYLKSRNASCVVIVDSINKYPLTDPDFSKIIKGFFRCIDEFSSINDNCQIYFCLPEELEHRVTRDMNIIRDGSGQSQVSRLKWRVEDLLRIVAKRYREFLSINYDRDNKDEESFFLQIKNLNFDERENIKFLFDKLLSESITNSSGISEPTLAYIIRHTQILPRDFISIFNRSIVSSYKSTKSWIKIIPNKVVESINLYEEWASKEIVKPFEDIYPLMCSEMGQQITSTGISSIFERADLKKLKGLSGFLGINNEDHLQILFDMGVIGYIHENEQNHGQNSIYEYARFCFNSEKNIFDSDKRRYCFHPIFSGSWQLRGAGSVDMKHIYPAAVPLEI